MTDGDPLADMAVNETREIVTTTEFSFLEAGWDSYVGHDREVADKRVVGVDIDGDRVCVELAADVTKVDPKVVPVFQTAERFESRPSQQPTPWWREYAGPAVTLGVVLALGAFASHLTAVVFNSGDMTINGEPMVSPPAHELFLIMVPMMLLAYAIPHLPRLYRRVRQ